MSQLEIACFGVIVFLTLMTLSQWMRRRSQRVGRIKRGLHSYVTAKNTPDTNSAAAKEPGGNLVTVL